jgi:hypothetical protein
VLLEWDQNVSVIYSFCGKKRGSRVSESATEHVHVTALSRYVQHTHSVSLEPALFVGAESARCPFANRRFTAGQRSGMTCGELQWLDRNNPQIKHLYALSPFAVTFYNGNGENI